MNESCVFCEIVARRRAASIVYEDDFTMAFLDLRQFHPGHTLVIPRRHLPDVRDLDEATGAAVMATVSRISRAVAVAFQTQGLSLWHSIGAAAFQEVPHLHIHVHPRTIGDDFLRIYPSTPPVPDEAERAAYAARLRAHL
ncbi:MAG: HIT family protein [Gemmatimonadaceae bacterium]